MTLARLNDPITSHLAAHMAQQFIGTHEDRIRQALAAHGPQIIDELAAHTGLTSVQVARRLPHMPDCYPTGSLRQSASGRAERVWSIRVTEQEKAA